MARFKFSLAALAFLAIASGPASATIETIDCGAPRLNAAEQTICRSQRLQVLDAKITEVYADKMYDRRHSATFKDNLRHSQFAFLARRNACGANYDCLDEVMSMRASRIHNYY